MTTPEQQRIIEAAWKTVSQTAGEDYRYIVDKLEREIDGEGCGCANCIRQAVEDMNWVTQFLDPMGSPSPNILDYDAVKKEVVLKVNYDPPLLLGWWLDMEE